MSKEFAVYMGSDECTAYGIVEADTAEEAAYEFETIIPREADEEGYYCESGFDSDQLDLYWIDPESKEEYYQCTLEVREKES